jgi:iron-sulfur cluster assembly accessory protein
LNGSALFRGRIFELYDSCIAILKMAQVLAASMRRPYLGDMSLIQDQVLLTASAAARVAYIAQRQSKPAILRLSVEGGGCSGFQYRFGLDEAVDAEDVSVEQDGVTLVVDPMSLDLVRGGTVDYVENLGGAAFKVVNPNATAGCGCGSSFSV